MPFLCSPWSPWHRLGHTSGLSLGPLVGGFGHQVRPLSRCSPIWKAVCDPGFLVQGQLCPLSLGLPVHAPPRPVHTRQQQRFEDVGRRQGLDFGPFICTLFPLSDVYPVVYGLCAHGIYIYIHMQTSPHVHMHFCTRAFGYESSCV